MTEHSLKKPYLITISKEKKYRVRAELHSQVMIDGQIIFQNGTLLNSLQRSPLHKGKTTQIVLMLKPHYNICVVSHLLHTTSFELPTYLHSPPFRIAPCVVLPTHFQSRHFSCYPYVLARCSFHAIQNPII